MIRDQFSSLQYYENTGDSANAVFTSSMFLFWTLLIMAKWYNINGNNHEYGHYSFVDIDGDSDLDVFELDFKGEYSIYYENMEIIAK